MLGMTREYWKQNEKWKCLFLFSQYRTKTKFKKIFLRMEILSDAYTIEHWLILLIFEHEEIIF